MSPEPPRQQELRGTSRLRSNELPPETLILLRGGPQEVATLVETAVDSGARYTLEGEWATFRNPRHYDIQLTAPTEGEVRRFLAVAGPLHDNRNYVADG